MRIFPQQPIPRPAIFGQVIVGTVTGSILLAESYEAAEGEAIAGPLLAAIEVVYARLPAVLEANGPSRFDFLVRQSSEAGECVDLFWSSGMRASTLLATVARKLIKVQTAVHRAELRLSPPTARGVTATEVEYRAADFDLPPIEFDFATVGRDA